jgi:hypothetical protein
MPGIWNQISVAQSVAQKGCAKSSRFSVFSRRQKQDKTRNKRDETRRKHHEIIVSRHEMRRKRHEIIVSRHETRRKRHEMIVSRRDIRVSSPQIPAFWANI